MDLLYRRNLINEIANSSSQITYIYGPSGFGKTSLARQYIEAAEIPAVWFDGRTTTTAKELALELSAAISAVLPELKADLEKLHLRDSFSATDIPDYMAILAKSKVNFLLIVDNAEEISGVLNEASLAFVKYLAKNIRLILIRSISPTLSNLKDLNFDRFQMITPEHLKFSKSEFRQFALNSVPDMPENHINLLFEFTEGWPQGIQVLVDIYRNLALNERDDFFNQLRRDGKLRIAHLAHKLLAHCTEEERKTLLSCSLASEIEPDTALALTDNVDSIQHLARLSGDSIVVSQISYEPPKFRINQLVRDALLDELRSTGQHKEVFAKTFNYLTKSGKIKELASILLESGDVARLRELVNSPEARVSIDSAIADAIARSAVGELRIWIKLTEYLTEYREFGHNLLSIYAEAMDGNLDAARAHLAQLNELVTDSKFKSFGGDALAADSVLAFLSGDLEKNKSQALKAHKDLQSRNASVRGHQLSYLQLATLSAVMTDDDKRVYEIEALLADVSKEQLSTRRSAQVLAMRSLLLAHQGKFAEAKSNLALPITFFAKDNAVGLFGQFGVRLAKAMIIAEEGDYSESAKLYEANLEEALRYKVWPVVVAAYCRKSYQLSLNNENEEALRHIGLARKIIDENKLSEQLHHVTDIWEARIRLFTGEYDRAMDLLNRCPDTYTRNALDSAIQVMRKSPKAATLLEKFDLQMPKQAITYHLFRAHMLAENPSKQLQEVRAAIEIGSSNGYFKHFLTQRTDVMQCYISIAAESPTVFNERLAREAGVRINEMMRRQSSTGSSLTRREADILRHLSTGIPIKEIAANLNISRNTIKTHLKNLYKKLGAVDRNDAVAKGRELLRV